MKKIFLLWIFFFYLHNNLTASTSALVLSEKPIPSSPSTHRPNNTATPFQFGSTRPMSPNRSQPLPQQTLYQEAQKSPYNIDLLASQQNKITEQKALRFINQQKTSQQSKTQEVDTSDVYGDSYFDGDSGYAGENSVSTTIDSLYSGVSAAASGISNWWYKTPATQSKTAPQRKPSASPTKISPATKQKILDDLNSGQGISLIDVTSSTDALDLARAQKPIKTDPKSTVVKNMDESKTPQQESSDLFNEVEYDWNAENSWSHTDQKSVDQYLTPKERAWKDVQSVRRSTDDTLTEIDAPASDDEQKLVASQQKPKGSFTLSTGTKEEVFDKIDPFQYDDKEETSKSLRLSVSRPISIRHDQNKDLDSDEQIIIELQAEDVASSWTNLLSITGEVLGLTIDLTAAVVDLGMRQILPEDTFPKQTPTASARTSVRQGTETSAKSSLLKNDTADLETDTLQPDAAAEDPIKMAQKMAAEKSFYASMKNAAQSIKDSPAKIRAFVKSLFEKLQIKLGMKKASIPDDVIDDAASDLKPLLQESNNPGFGSGIMKWFTKKVEMKDTQITYSKEQQEVVWQKTKQSEYIHGAQEVRFTYQNGKFSEITINYLGKDITFQHGQGFTGKKNPDGSFSIELTTNSYQTLSRMKQDLTKSVLDKAGGLLEKGVSALSNNIYNLGAVETSINIGTAWTTQESTTILENISITFTPKHSVSGSQFGVSQTLQRPAHIKVTNTFKRAGETYPTRATFSADV
jgi:hypothetical protein